MQHRNILHFGLLLPSFLFLAGCSGDSRPVTGERRETPVIVVTAKPYLSLAEDVSASGQIEAVRSASVSTRLMGVITHVHVKMGDKVKQGQLLATISSEDITAKKAQAQAQIAAAEANMDNARKDLDRYTALFARQSATASELDNASLRFHAARSGLEAAEQMRKEIDASAAYARLTAPFTGVVTQRLMDEGSLATPGTPILTIEQDGLLRVNATIAESDISRIRTGDPAELEVKSTGDRATGSITEISVSSIASGGQYQVKISLPPGMQKNVYAGMYVNVFISLKAQPADSSRSGSVLVPQSALVKQDQLTGIYTIGNGNTALLRWIRTGKRSGDKVEVLSGLSTDEPFILTAAGKLYNGAPVQEKQ